MLFIFLLFFWLLIFFGVLRVSEISFVFLIGRNFSDKDNFGLVSAPGDATKDRIIVHFRHLFIDFQRGAESIVVPDLKEELLLILVTSSKSDLNLSLWCLCFNDFRSLHGHLRQPR
jgi:hypothetical protein